MIKLNAIEIYVIILVYNTSITINEYYNLYHWSDCPDMSGMVTDENGNSVQVNIEEPRWDQSTYLGRARHFFTTANPLNVFATPSQLDQANNVVTKFRRVRQMSDNNYL